MPEGLQIDPTSENGNITLVNIDGEECYGVRPGGLPCPNTDQLVEFSAIIKGDGIRIEGHFYAVPVVKSFDNTNYGTVGPDNPSSD